jgi:hypothetical protein
MLSVCLCSLYQLLNALTDLYKTWYVYHGTWSRLEGVLHKPLHQSVYLFTLLLKHLQHNEGDQKIRKLMLWDIDCIYEMKLTLGQYLITAFDTNIKPSGYYQRIIC